MLYQLRTKDAYDPETIDLMAAALAKVFHSVPELLAGNDEVRQQCASKILGLVDRGQRDPALLYKLTLDALSKTKCRAPTIPESFRMTL